MRKSMRELKAEKRELALVQIERQVASGRLRIRQMTPAERAQGQLARRRAD